MTYVDYLCVCMHAIKYIHTNRSSKQWLLLWPTKSYTYTRFPFGMCLTWNPGCNASWLKGTRRNASWLKGTPKEGNSSSHSLFVFEEKWWKKQERRSSCWLLLRSILFTLKNMMKYKKRQLWDRGFLRNSSLQAVWDTSIARTTGFMLPHQRCESLLRGTKSDSCGTQWVYKYDVCGYGHVCDLT